MLTGSRGNRRRQARPQALLALATVAALLSGCAGGQTGAISSPAGAQSGTPPTPSTTTVTVTASPAPAAPAPAPTFAAQVRELTATDRAAMTGVTWREGCPVGLDELRHVTLSYWTFDGGQASGALVVHRDAVQPTVAAFATLFDQRFPIRRMKPIEAYGGDDFASIEADNTSAFNCRMTTGSRTKWSNHAYGRAIDINPIENPYVSRGTTSHPASQTYLNRSDLRPGMITDGSTALEAFEDQGFSWGGRWSEPIDTQHFDLAGPR